MISSLFFSRTRAAGGLDVVGSRTQPSCWISPLEVADAVSVEVVEGLTCSSWKTASLYQSGSLSGFLGDEIRSETKPGARGAGLLCARETAASGEQFEELTPVTA
jgi:hypothetical protein